MEHSLEDAIKKILMEKEERQDNAMFRALCSAVSIIAMEVRDEIAVRSPQRAERLNDVARQMGALHTAFDRRST